MRLGRLVAAGLVAGAVAGFVGALLRPRSVRTDDADGSSTAGAPADAQPVDPPCDDPPCNELPADDPPADDGPAEVGVADLGAAAPDDALAVAGAADPSARGRGAAG